MDDIIEEFELEDEWDVIYSEIKKLKSKSTSSFDTNLKKKGVFSVQIKILSRIAVPGRNADVKITLSGANKKEYFKDEKLLYPSISKTKQEFNTWFLFIPIEDDYIDSLLSISFKSNAILKSLEISTIIKYMPGNSRLENIEIIEEYKKKMQNLLN